MGIHVPKNLEPKIRKLKALVAKANRRKVSLFYIIVPDDRSGDIGSDVAL